MSTAIILVVGFAALWVAGVPMVYMLRGCLVGGMPAKLALAPFLGFGAISCLLTPFFAAGVPLRWVVWPVLAVLIAAFGYTVYRKGGNLQQIAHTESIAFFVVAALVAISVSVSYFWIGAEYYTGYAWWDPLFYGTRVEWILNHGVGELAAAAATTPYVAPGLYYSGGIHRYCMGLVQAFVAGVSGVDGAATIGFVSIASTVLLFCGALYFADGLRLRVWQKYAAAASCALLPIAVMTQAEGFLPVALAISFNLAVFRLLSDVLRSPTLTRCVIVGIFLTGSVGTLSETAYFIVPAILVTGVAHFAASRVRLGRLLASFGVMACTVAVCTLPLGFDPLLEPFRGDRSRSNLNSLYPFGVKGLSWAAFGTVSDAGGGVLVVLLSFVGLLLVVAGVLGVFTELRRRRHVELLNSLVILMGALGCLVVPNYGYVLFKMASFAAPILVIGNYLFINQMEPAILRLGRAAMQSRRNGPSLPRHHIKGVVALGLAASLQVAFIAGSAVSVARMSGLHDGLFWYVGRGNPQIYSARNAFDKLAEYRGRSLLIVGPTGFDLTYWWAIYFARDNAIYALNEGVDSAYLAGHEFPRCDPRNVPLDAVIIDVPGYENRVTPVDWQANVAATLAYFDGDSASPTTANMSPVSAWTGDHFELSVFARVPTISQLHLSIIPSRQDRSVVIAGRRNRVPAGTESIVLPLSIPQGGTRVSLVADSGPISVIEWSLAVDRTAAAESPRASGSRMAGTR